MYVANQGSEAKGDCAQELTEGIATPLTVLGYHRRPPVGGRYAVNL